MDCSVALKWFVPEPLSDEAEILLDRFQSGADHLFAPGLLLAEFGHSLLKRRQGQGFTPDEIRQFWEEFLELGIETVPIATLARDAMRLALDRMANYYDAVYVALARSRGCSVLTADGHMTRAFESLGCVTPLQTLAP